MSRIQRPYAHWNSSTLQVAVITSEAAQTRRHVKQMLEKMVQQLAVGGTLKFWCYFAESVRNYTWNEAEAQLYIETVNTFTWSGVNLLLWDLGLHTALLVSIFAPFWPQFWLYMLQCTITLIWLELSWIIPYKYKLACQCVYKTKLVHTLSVTYGNFPHLIHLYSPCLHHSTSAQQCNSRPCSGTPCLSIYACLPWKEHTGSHTITNTVGMNKGLACSGLGEPFCVCVLTTLFITVVPTVVVAITVPEAANTVAVLTVKLVLLTLPGSYAGRKKWQTSEHHITQTQWKDTKATLKSGQL